MNTDFLQDMEYVMAGDRPMSFAMNTEFPYGPEEEKAYNRIMALRETNPNFTVDQFNAILREYQMSFSK